MRETRGSADALEHVQATLSGAGHALIGNAVQVNQATELDLLVEGLAKPGSDAAEDVGFLDVRVIESGGINEVDAQVAVVESEGFDLSRD